MGDDEDCHVKIIRFDVEAEHIYPYLSSADEEPLPRRNCLFCFVLFELKMAFRKYSVLEKDMTRRCMHEIGR